MYQSIVIAEGQTTLLKPVREALGVVEIGRRPSHLIGVSPEGPFKLEHYFY